MLYDFQPAILRTNKKINNEARRFLYYDNLFVLVGYSHRDHLETLRTGGLTLLAARKDELRCSWSSQRISLHVNLWSPRSEDLLIESKFVFAADELWLFCKTLERFDNDFPTFFSRLRLILGIFPSYHLGIDDSVTTLARPLPQQRMLLEPFSKLQSTKNLKIINVDGMTEGIDAQLMEDVKNKAGRLPQSMKEILLTTNRITDQGNEAFHAGDFRRAFSLYESAWKNLDAGKRYLEEASKAGELTKYFCEHFQLGLRIWSNSVAALLRLQQWKNAHKMATEVIEDIALTKDNEGETLYPPCELGKLYYRRALASEGMGKMAQAVEEIHEALRFDPASREMNAKLREWKL